MAAATTPRETLRKDGDVRGYGVLTNTTILKGTLVCINASGWLVPGADTANFHCVGVAEETVVATAADASGAKKCRVRSGASFLFIGVGLTQAMLGTAMHIVDNQTFQQAIGTNSVCVGRLVEFISSTSGYIYIPSGGLRGGVAAVVTDLIS